MKKKLTAVTVALLLSACGQNEPTQTVDWYKAHDSERLTMLERCKNSPGERGLTPNCLNAQQADNEIKNARRGYAPLKPLGSGG